MSLIDPFRPKAAAAPPPPKPVPVVGIEVGPHGTVTLGGQMYRLPRSTSAVHAAHNLQMLAEAFGTVNEMRLCGVPEEVVQRHIPKPPARPELPAAPTPLPAVILASRWPAGSTALGVGERPIAGSRVHAFSEQTGTCRPAVVERIVDCYKPLGVELGSVDAYSMVHPLDGGRPFWCRYLRAPQKLDRRGYEPQVESWHRTGDHVAS